MFRTLQIHDGRMSTIPNTSFVENYKADTMGNCLQKKVDRDIGAIAGNFHCKGYIIHPTLIKILYVIKKGNV